MFSNFKWQLFAIMIFASSNCYSSFKSKEFNLCLERVFQYDQSRLKFNRLSENLKLSCKHEMNFFQCTLMNSKNEKSVLKLFNGSAYVDLKGETKNLSIKIKETGIEDNEKSDAIVYIKNDLDSNGLWVWESFFKGQFCK